MYKWLVGISGLLVSFFGWLNDDEMKYRRRAHIEREECEEFKLSHLNAVERLKMEEIE